MWFCVFGRVFARFIIIILSDQIERFATLFPFSWLANGWPSLSSESFAPHSPEGSREGVLGWLAILSFVEVSAESFSLLQPPLRLAQFLPVFGCDLLWFTGVRIPFTFIGFPPIFGPGDGNHWTLAVRRGSRDRVTRASRFRPLLRITLRGRTFVGFVVFTTVQIKRHFSRGTLPSGRRGH